MTAREQRHGKTGYMDSRLSPILDRLGISKSNWYIASSEFESVFSTFVGQKESLISACSVYSKKRIHLQSHCLRLLSG